MTIVRAIAETLTHCTGVVEKPAVCMGVSDMNSVCTGVVDNMPASNIMEGTL